MCGMRKTYLNHHILSNEIYEIFLAFVLKEKKLLNKYKFRMIHSLFHLLNIIV